MAGPYRLGRLPSIDGIGGRTLAWPSVMAYASDLASYRSGAEAVMHMITSGVAHVLLESGRSAGGLLLVP